MPANTFLKYTLYYLSFYTCNCLINAGVLINLRLLLQIGKKWADWRLLVMQLWSCPWETKDLYLLLRREEHVWLVPVKKGRRKAKVRSKTIKPKCKMQTGASSSLSLCTWGGRGSHGSRSPVCWLPLLTVTSLNSLWNKVNVGWKWIVPGAQKRQNRLA